MNSLNILIVEDETIMAADIQETLVNVGHRITNIARDYQEALVAIRRHPPDLAIIDIQLVNSTADGVQIARELTNQRWLPIIYLTGHSDSATVQRAKETSPAAYLLKPFKHNELVIQVELAYYNFQSSNGKPVDPVASDSLFLPYNKGYEKIVKHDIIYLRAYGSYTHIYLKDDDKPLLFTLNLGYLAQYFSVSNFYRVSRSLFVNLDHVRRLERTQLIMSNQKAISIPEGGRSDLLKKLSVIRTR